MSGETQRWVGERSWQPSVVPRVYAEEQTNHVAEEKEYQITVNSLSDKMPKYFVTKQEKISYY